MSDVFLDVDNSWFDGAQKEPEYDNSPIPAGIYSLVCVKAEKTTARSGQEYMKLRHRVADGQHKGRYVFDNVFAWYESADKEKQAKVIAINGRKLGALSFSSGAGAILESASDYVGIIFDAVVGVEIDKTGQYEDKNVIKKYFAKNIGGRINLADFFKKKNTPDAALPSNVSDEELEYLL